MTVHKAAYPLKNKDTELFPNFFFLTNDLPISVCRERLPYTLKSPTKKRKTFLHNVHFLLNSAVEERERAKKQEQPQGDLLV